MCDGFGGFYHKSGKVFFTTPNDNGDCSHGDTAEKLPKGIKDNNLIPFEIPDWLTRKFHWDMTSVPDWADKSACIAKLKEVKPIWAEYQKVRTAALAEMIAKLKQIDGYLE